MTAKDARQWAGHAATADQSKADVAITCWHKAIEKAAKAGRSSVRESDLVKVRTPIPAATWAAAEKQLKADGFTVKTVATGQNETETEVSW